MTVDIHHIEHGIDLLIPALGTDPREALPALMMEGLRHMSCWAREITARPRAVDRAVGEQCYHQRGHG